MTAVQRIYMVHVAHCQFSFLPMYMYICTCTYAIFPGQDIRFSSNRELELLKRKLDQVLLDVTE